MRHPVLILGGYGNFGKRIAAALAKAHIGVTIAGRNRAKAEALVHNLPSGLANIAILDVQRDLDQLLQSQAPAVVINTCGPFQTSDYSIAGTCIRHRTNYIDLADGRDFVSGITALDRTARNNSVLVVSGASSVPGLSSAVIEHYKNQFSTISSLKYGISPGQKTERGLATTQGILTYVGKQLKPFAGRQTAHGWQDIYRQAYPDLGKRWMANCDVPDLDLFPARYAIPFIQFSAGLEIGLLHLGLWGLSWLVRLGLPVDLPKHAKTLLKLSNVLNPFGSSAGGMHMLIEGLDREGAKLRKEWYIIAENGHGPQIPTVPAIILAKKIVREELRSVGALPCVGLVSLDEYLAELRDFAIRTVES